MNNYINKTFHRILLEKLLLKNKDLISGKIIDIGSKNRRYDDLFSGEITATDLKANPDHEIIYGNIEEKLHFPDEYFDSLICIEVFEYLEKYDFAISEIHRLLKKNGRAIISIPFMYNDHQDKMRFTADFISQKFIDFSDVKILKIGNGYTIIWDIIRKKILSLKNKFIRRFCFLLILPLLVLIKLFSLEEKNDLFYSGIFIILKK